MVVMTGGFRKTLLSCVSNHVGDDIMMTVFRYRKAQNF